MIWDGARHRPFACEGGHADLAARDALEAELLAWLQGRFGHVSCERVLSGPGLLNIFRFLVETGRGTPAAAVVEAMRELDPSAVIAEAARRGQCAVCRQTLDRFVSFYGAEAGNLALKLMATGGVFVGGGIAPRIALAMTAGGFLEAFLDKGRMRPLLETMPLRIILNPGTALLGAARCAASLSRSTDVGSLAHES
jgi:glucokinase